MLATLLSAGNSTSKISEKNIETAISQVFICIYPTLFSDERLQEKLVQEIINFTKNVETITPEDTIFYPGERSAQNRANNLKEGILINDSIWEKVLNLTYK